QVTDDRGAYRLYGLAPGEYLVAATMRPVDAPIAGPPTRALSSADAQRALAAVTRPQSGVPHITDEGGDIPDMAGQTVRYAPLLFPGVTDPSAATRVPVAVGEVRDGISFQLQRVRT